MSVSENSHPAWICSQIGSREYYAIPNVLHQEGRLAGLITDWYAPRNPLLQWLVSRGSRSALLAKSGIIPHELVRSFPLRSLLWRAEILAMSSKGRIVEAQEYTDRAFALAVASLRLPPHQIFFGYSYASLEILRAERQRGVKTVLGQIDPGAWECRLVAEEMARFPEFAGPPSEFPASYYERNQREWECADRVMVNSAFSRDALIQQGVSPQKLVVVPLCFEPKKEALADSARARQTYTPGQPLRVLFLGQVNLRKGIHYLIEAARLLDPAKVQFEVVGPMGIKPEAAVKAPRNVTFHGRATRDQTANWYRQSDVFVLPTLSDGFAITQLEAMSYGLPVIATPCCGEVVSDGVDGFIVPPRDPEALATTLLKYREQPELLEMQGTLAVKKAGQFSMERLAQNLKDIETDLTVPKSHPFTFHKKPSRVGVFHPGTQHSWQTALGLQAPGMLAWYATSAFYVPSRWPYKIEGYLPAKYSAKLRTEFMRRHHPLLEAQNVRQFGVWEWLEVFLRRTGQQGLSNRVNLHGNRMFGQQVAKLIEREPVDTVWGYNSSSLEVFEFARQRGIRCILDQTIGHPATQNRVMLQEQARHPEFFLNAYQPYDREWIDRQNAELELADIVVVGAESCARTLIENGCPPEKIQVINYGYDAHLFAMEQPVRSSDPKLPLKCLFVGEVGPRKGAAYLLQALANLPADQVELTLVGNLAIPEATFKKYAKRVTHYPQVPRSAVPDFFRNAHCFVFPSLFEGSALVLYEAIGAGMGIIQTEQSGTGAHPGRNGEVISDISVPALVKAIGNLAANRNVCEQWQSHSWANRQSFTWDGYRQRITQLVSELR